MRRLYLEASGTGLLLMVQGENIREDVNRTAEFVYTGLHDTLPLLPDGPYALLLSEGERGAIEWLLAVAAEEKAVEALHARFASQFSPAAIRTRTIPTGRTVSDVIVAGRIVTGEETIGGFAVRTTRHGDAEEAFISAERRDVILLGNTGTLLKRGIRAAGFRGLPPLLHPLQFPQR